MPRFLSLCFLLPFVATAQNPATVVSNAHRIVSYSPMNSTSCSATAIGPYALLTASHCERPSAQIKVDGKWIRLAAIDRDGQDHSILYLTGTEPFISYAPVTQNDPRKGSVAAMAGNPGNAQMIYRTGTFSGTYNNPLDLSDELVFDFPSIPGDSGSGIFDESGTVYAVESNLVNLGEGDFPMWMPGAYPLFFTKTQLDRARTLVPTPEVLRKQHGPLIIVLIEELPDMPDIVSTGPRDPVETRPRK